MKNSNLNIVQKTIIGAQFLFVAFGATVLVPLLVGMDPSVALLTAGVGTLIFHAVTKGKVPVFLASLACSRSWTSHNAYRSSSSGYRRKYG